MSTCQDEKKAVCGAEKARIIKSIIDKSNGELVANAKSEAYKEVVQRAEEKYVDDFSSVLVAIRNVSRITIVHRTNCNGAFLH